MRQQTQLTFTCSKSPIEAIEKGRNMFKVNNKNTRTTYFTFFSVVSIGDFEQVNVSWVIAVADEIANTHLFNPYQTNVPFLYPPPPLKTAENFGFLTFSGV